MLKKKISDLFKTGFFHIFGSSVISKMLSFAGGILLVRILSKPEYGIYTYAWNIYSIILIFSGFGMDSAALQLSSEHSSDTQSVKKYCGYSTRFGLRFNILLCLTILLIGAFARLKIEEARGLLLMTCLLPPLQHMSAMFAIYLRSQKNNQRYSKLMIISSAVFFAASVTSALILGRSGIVLGSYISLVTSLIICFAVYRIRFSDDDIPTEEKSVIKRIAFISMLNNGLSQLLYLLDIFVLGIVDPQETLLASYKVATIIPTALSFIPASLVTYIYPYFAEHKDDGKWCLKAYRKMITAFGAFNLFVSAFLFAFAPIIIRLLFGEQYSDCVTVFRMLSVNYFFSGTFRIVSGNLLVTQRKLKFNLLTAITSSVCNIVFDYFFITKWGSVGAAAATMGVVFISAVMSTTYLIFTLKAKAKD